MTSVFYVIVSSSLSSAAHDIISACPQSPWCYKQIVAIKYDSYITLSFKCLLISVTANFAVFMHLKLVNSTVCNWTCHFSDYYLAEWYHTQLSSSVHCAMPWAMSLSLGDKKLFFGHKHNIYALFMILHGLFGLILLFVCQICHMNCETENFW